MIDWLSQHRLVNSPMLSMHVWWPSLCCWVKVYTHTHTHTHTHSERERERRTNSQTDNRHWSPQLRTACMMMMMMMMNWPAIGVGVCLLCDAAAAAAADGTESGTRSYRSVNRLYSRTHHTRSRRSNWLMYAHFASFTYSVVFCTSSRHVSKFNFPFTCSTSTNKQS